MERNKEMSNDTAQKEKEEKHGLNPLSWGMLFFAFWLALIVWPVEVDVVPKTILTWFCFGLSALLLIAIYIPWLREQYERPRIKSVVLPIVFEITIASFVVAFITSLNGMEECIRSITIYGGFIWVVTYLLILIRVSNKGIGILASVVFLGRGIHLVSQAQNEPDMVAGIVSMLLGIVSGYIATKRPKWLWHRSLI